MSNRLVKRVNTCIDMQYFIVRKMTLQLPERSHGPTFQVVDGPTGIRGCGWLDEPKRAQHDSHDRAPRRQINQAPAAQQIRTLLPSHDAPFQRGTVAGQPASTAALHPRAFDFRCSEVAHHRHRPSQRRLSTPFNLWPVSSFYAQIPVLVFLQRPQSADNWSG